MERPTSRGASRWSLAVAAVTIVAVVAACSSSKSSSTNKGPTTTGNASPVGSQIKGGTVTFAEGPGAPPNYIFPIIPGSSFSTANISQFQVLMYRPLYWFGNDNKPSLDDDYSLANQPVYSDGNRTVTITMKGWKWSDGETVSARDVVFFLNLLKQEKSNYGGYVPGLFPDSVVSYSNPDANTVVLHLDKGYNPTWFTYNQLAEITPLPLAWDRTSAGAPAPTSDDGHLPDATPAGAKAVFTFLAGLAKSTSGYASSPVWSVVDGPWKLSEFTSAGQATFVPNPSYSGTVQPKIDKFVEVPFTSEPPELNLVKTGPAHLNVGYLPTQDLPQRDAVAAEGYNVVNGYSFSFNFFPLNLHNPTFGPVFSQLYFRQAFEHLVNQRGWVHAFSADTATPTFGAVPANPANSFVDTNGQHEAYAYDVKAASKLLSDHGWDVKPNGVTTCRDAGSLPSQCGAGIPAGLKLSFNLDYASGPVIVDQEMKDLKSTASQVGIDIQLTSHPFPQVIGAAAQCKPTEATCKWTAENWGGGWVYSPDFYPSGEELFQTSAVANFENWSDPHADELIAATTTASAADAQSALDAYADYIQLQAPVVFTPVIAGNPIGDGPTLVSKHIGGFALNAYAYITPEAWYLTK